MKQYASIEELGKAAPTILPAIINLPSGDKLGDDVLNAALLSASDRINGYIATRYTKPFSVVPAMLKDLSIDIAIYLLARDHGRLSDDIRKRYEDAIVTLKDIAKGVLDLAFAYEGNISEEVIEEKIGNEAWAEGDVKLFSRASMKEF